MKKYFHILLILLISNLIANSRVSFLRPGALMRLSNNVSYNNNELFSVALGSEVTSVGDIISHSSGFAINKTNSNGASWGFSYSLLPYDGINSEDAESDLDYEVGFHFQSNLYSAGRTNITAGIHDILLDTEETISLNDLSIFINFSNNLLMNAYSLTSLLGFGSGRLAFDPHTQYSSSSGLGLYAGMKLNTPIINHWGGVDFLTEFAHGGLNVGLSIPFTQEYKFCVGITHIENLSDFALQS